MTDDPIRDAAEHDAELEKRISELPVCCECGERIGLSGVDVWYYDFDGDMYCEDCVNKHMRYMR